MRAFSLYDQYKSYKSTTHWGISVAKKNVSHGTVTEQSSTVPSDST